MCISGLQHSNDLLWVEALYNLNKLYAIDYCYSVTHLILYSFAISVCYCLKYLWSISNKDFSLFSFLNHIFQLLASLLLKVVYLFWLLLSVQCGSAIPEEGSSCIQWEDCKEKIDLVALASKEPILFYDEVVTRV